MTRYHVSSQSLDKYVRLRILNYSLYVPNPHEMSHEEGHENEHLKDADPHLVNAVLEEIVRQFGAEGTRVSNGQIMLFAKGGHQGKCSGLPIVGMPNARDVEKALEAVGYQRQKKH